ncbi:uncharacterized protein TA07485 [Theileria annulata]|uniref:AMMECR1 domain-containing protein n=1 Tax=Theileria annulata TaxID=5874 RepID=Q4UA50_THEAN|nr:uncharacterized protein TA07485 [Theileria annulata]CAI76303.1 hypothetical protein, conserved [Theileria annulata]|eukprot:XP_952927.1 hypothetical protein, conserved [Theileria annulata]
MTSGFDKFVEDVDDSLCSVCFDVLEEELNDKTPVTRDCLSKLTSQGAKCPLFVTWNLKNGDDEELRGCIGTLEPTSLNNLKRYARMSAFQDSRFPPVRSSEIKHLVCKLSLLHSYEECKDYLDWEVGKHGLVVEFDYNGFSYSATYLPEVALEHNMSKEYAVEQLVITNYVIIYYRYRLGKVVIEVELQKIFYQSLGYS